MYNIYHSKKYIYIYKYEDTYWPIGSIPIIQQPGYLHQSRPSSNIDLTLHWKTGWHISCYFNNPKVSPPGDGNRSQTLAGPQFSAVFQPKCRFGDRRIGTHGKINASSTPEIKKNNQRTWMSHWKLGSMVNGSVGYNPNIQTICKDRWNNPLIRSPLIPAPALPALPGHPSALIKATGLYSEVVIRVLNL